MKWRIAIILSGLLSFSCASPPKHKAYPVLEPADPPPKETEEKVVRPNYERLVKLLLSLGYEPVGMEFETDANLDLLNNVFSNPLSHNRKIKLVYTGLQMAYDKAAESLTIGGLTNVISILAYLQRNVPLNTQGVAAPPPTPILRPAPSVVPKTSSPKKTSPSGMARAVGKPARPAAPKPKASTPAPSKPVPPPVEVPAAATETIDPVPEAAPPVSPPEEIMPEPESPAPPIEPPSDAAAPPTPPSETEAVPVPESKNKVSPDLIPSEEIPTE